MADFNYDDDGVIPRMSGAQFKTFVNVAGAVCSFALIAGVAVWGYRLAVRDVSGIPVIRAVEGPLRVAPDNPGGEIADHQGMAVNAIAELDQAEAMPDEIVLAPGPLELSLEDTAGLAATLAAEPPAPVLPMANTVPLAGSDPLAEVLRPIEVAAPPATAPVLDQETDAPLSTSDAVELALAEALAGDSSVEGLSEAATDGVVEVALQEAPDASGGIARSPRPQARPQQLRMAEVAQVSATPTASVSTTAEIDPASLAIGTRLVQLGAFDTVDQARQEWAKLAGRFGDLMTGKSVVVQSAESGGRTFYRLRAHGFDGEDDARRFCMALLAEDAACIPVAHR